MFDIFEPSYYLDARRVELYRWVDPVMGPRQTPSIDRPLDGLERIPADAVFTLVNGQVQCTAGDLGSGIVYRISDL